MGEWLGHRDPCPSVCGEPCDCPCGDIACPGRDRCKDPDCVLAVGDFSEPDNCHSVEVDGETVLVRGGEMDETDRMHFAEIVRAAKRKYEIDHQ